MATPLKIGLQSQRRILMISGAAKHACLPMRRLMSFPLLLLPLLLPLSSEISSLTSRKGSREMLPCSWCWRIPSSGTHGTALLWHRLKHEMFLRCLIHLSSHWGEGSFWSQEKVHVCCLWVLQTDKGKALVRSYELTADAQKIYYELCEDALRSTCSSIDSSRLLS